MRTKIVLLAIIGTVICLIASGTLHAQGVEAVNAPDLLPPIGLPFTPGTVSNLVSDTGTHLGQLPADGYNALAKLSWTAGFDVAVVGLWHDGCPGAGVVITPASTNLNNPIRAGFGIFGLQEKDPVTGKRSINFYDATLTLSYERTEVIPVIELPVRLVLGTGPAVKLSGGTGVLMEQSDLLGEYTFDFGRHSHFTVGGGLVHCSGLSGSGVADAFYFRYEYLF